MTFSLQVLQSEQLLDFGVVGVLLSDPPGVVGADTVPHPVSQVGVEQSAGVEAVAALDHLARLPVVQEGPLEHLLGREVEVDQVEVGVAVPLSDDLLVDVGELLGPGGGAEADGAVAVEPASAGTDFKAVQEVVDLIVAHVERVGAVLQTVEKQVPFRQSQDGHVAASGQGRVEPVEQFEDVLLEAVDGGVAAGVAAADVVADEFEEEEDGVVVLLVAVQGLDVAPGVPRIPTVDCDVLEVVVVAEVPLPQFLVDGVGGVGGVGVPGVGRLVGQVELVGHPRQQVIETPLPHHRHVEELLGDREVGAGRVPSHHHSQPRAASAELLLETVPLEVGAEDGVAVVVAEGGAGFAAGVDLGVELVAVFAPPVVATEGTDVGEGVVVEVEGRHVAVPEMVDEEVDQPLPGRGDRQFQPGRRQSGDGSQEVVLGAGVDDPALGVLAHSGGVANHVAVLALEEALDEVGAGVVHEGLAGGLDQSVEQAAELLVDELGHVPPVVADVVLHHPAEHGAEGALVVEPVVLLPPHEVCVGALHLQPGQSGVDLLVEFQPVVGGEHADQFGHHEGAVGGGRRRGDLGAGDVDLLVEGLAVVEHLHEDGEDAAGVPSPEMAVQAGHVPVEMLEHVHARAH